MNDPAYDKLIRDLYGNLPTATVPASQADSANGKPTKYSSQRKPGPNRMPGISFKRCTPFVWLACGSYLLRPLMFGSFCGIGRLTLWNEWTKPESLSSWALIEKQ